MSAALSSPAALADAIPIGQWLAPLPNWPAAAVSSLATNGSVIRIVIASVRGSAPRTAGTCMLVDSQRIFGTIGGGQLEWTAITSARNMLADSNAPAVHVGKLILGPQLAQCCGGAVELWMERYARSDLPLLYSAKQTVERGKAFLVSKLAGASVEHRVLRYPAVDEPARRMLRTGTRAELVREEGSITLRERLDEDRPLVWLYGAGHVGQALARVLVTLPMRLTWIDSRPELLPAEVASHAHIVVSGDPVVSVGDAPPGTHFLIMTHSHVLDYELCKAVVKRGDQAWVGLIGSHSKSVRFRSRLLQEGIPMDQVERLVCPVGVGGIESKEPAVIAVSIAAQVLQTFTTAPAPTVEQVHECAAGSCHNCGLQPGSTP